MRVTKRTNIAFRILMYCAVNADRLVTRSEIAARCNTSESHMAQVINQLGQLGHLYTQRGRMGGIALARPMDRIEIGAVFRQFEAGAPIAECFADVGNTCPLVAGCRLRPAIADAAEAFYAHFDGMTLADLVCGNDMLFDMLPPEPCAKRA